MTVGRREPAQGVQYGSGNEQRNYFAPVTQYLFSGGFERLRDVCFDPAPLARDLDLARFTGREWLIRQIDAFITGRPRGYVIIQAEAGMGKSTLAAHLAGTRPWLCHFTRLPGGRSPEAARKSLAAQLIAQWDLLQEWVPEGVLPVSSARQDWFSRLLAAAARKRDQQAPDEEHREPIVIVVDGLDEAEPEAGAGIGAAGCRWGCRIACRTGCMWWRPAGSASTRRCTRSATRPTGCTSRSRVSATWTTCAGSSGISPRPRSATGAC